MADFIGECNFLDGRAVSCEKGIVTVDVNGTQVQVASEKQLKKGDACRIVLRPEAVLLSDMQGIPGRVELSCFMGSYQNYHIRVGDTLVKITDNCPANKKVYRVGDGVKIGFAKECVHLL